MNNILVQIYYSTSSKYIKFRKRLDKSISTGKFRQFTKRKQSQLLHKIERLRRRVMQLQTQLKLAAAGATISLFLNTSPVQAQTSLGPFVVPPPPLPFVQKPVPTFVDLDGDGDLDLVVGDLNSQRLLYFKNTGTSSKANFEEISNVDSAYPFGNVGSLGSVADEYKSWVPAFTDVDGDGDYDLLLGVDEHSLKYGTYDGPTYFFRNNGSDTSPDFVAETGPTNPFDGIKSLRYAHPTFADLDNDGDSDLLLEDITGLPRMITSFNIGRTPAQHRPPPTYKIPASRLCKEKWVIIYSMITLPGVIILQPLPILMKMGTLIFSLPFPMVLVTTILAALTLAELFTCGMMAIHLALHLMASFQVLPPPLIPLKLVPGWKIRAIQESTWEILLMRLTKSPLAILMAILPLPLLILMAMETWT